ncbi:major facilitator superfamily transporter [Colletotrichum karsti]|uniref:Major facilitator superfamily transporter n=1 Tax=Colletotrichum karsti TaxID=1095194 RepID=A0A9P6LP89_9PEZI|nr:major facilitator superfamily transporter [Colletotrichum karsti]KAF9880545.1 major facilitator superfamily transporter [Colletotrichum karsti]
MSRLFSSPDPQETISSFPSGKAIQVQEVIGSEPVSEPAMNRRINRKMDIALLPLLSLLYLFNGLDRGNVGNAQTQGFTTDIGAVPDDLNLSVSLFFITFVLFQPPSAAVGRWLGAKHWIPIMMVGYTSRNQAQNPNPNSLTNEQICWGFITLVQAFIKGRGALIATRLLIGAFEAGFYPTAVAYLSFFYSRYDLAVRVGLFYGQYAVAGAFSGAIAYGVFHLRDGPFKNWQYLFIIEGTLTIFFGLFAWFLLPSGPGSAWFLTLEEREFAAERMRQENALFVEHTYGQNGIENDRLKKRDFIETFRDWKFWYVLVFNICASVPGQAFSVFLPLVVQGLGYSSIEANLMSVPPYVCGALGLYLFALSSDYHKERGYHIVGGIVIALVGLIATVTVESHAGKYAALCVLLLGSYIAAPLTVAWLSGNNPEPGKRSLILGVNGFGNLSGVIGAQLYRDRYKPNYKLPFYVTLGFVAVALVGYISFRFILVSINRKKIQIMRHKTQEDIERERVDNTRYADTKWTFIYGL